MKEKSLEAFIQEFQNSLDSFEDYWKKNKFPDNLQEGEWYEQFLCFVECAELSKSKS
jgi:hypothetical protein